MHDRGIRETPTPVPQESPTVIKMYFEAVSRLASITLPFNDPKNLNFVSQVKEHHRPSINPSRKLRVLANGS